MPRTSAHQPGLFYFAVFTAFCTLCLIGLGGLVTSHGVGMAVPDWPTTYGYNMFLFPISQWTGGIFYEHTHRLFASFIGLLTTVLAMWLWIRERRRWLRWLGVLAFVLVGLQGVLGGLRVVMYKDEIGIFHATLAQLFLILMCAIALWTSPWWRRWNAKSANETVSSRLRFVLWASCALVLGQLALGATMRHEHAGLAIPDFPTAYGGWWPPMDDASIQEINRSRTDTREFNPITATHMMVHMAHRIGAVLILALIGMAAWLSSRSSDGNLKLRGGIRIWLGMVVLQALLGAVTIWSNKAADMATLHVMLGAASLAWGALLVILSHKFSVAEDAALRHSGAAISNNPSPNIKSAMTVS